MPVWHAQTSQLAWDFGLPPYLSKTVFLHLLHRFTGFLIFFYIITILIITYKQNLIDQFKE